MVLHGAFHVLLGMAMTACLYSCLVFPRASAQLQGSVRIDAEGASLKRSAFNSVRELWDAFPEQQGPLLLLEGGVNGTTVLHRCRPQLVAILGNRRGHPTIPVHDASCLKYSYPAGLYKVTYDLPKEVLATAFKHVLVVFHPQELIDSTLDELQTAYQLLTAVFDTAEFLFAAPYYPVNWQFRISRPKQVIPNLAEGDKQAYFWFQSDWAARNYPASPTTSDATSATRPAVAGIGIDGPQSVPAVPASRDASSPVATRKQPIDLTLTAATAATAAADASSRGGGRSAFPSTQPQGEPQPEAVPPSFGAQSEPTTGETSAREQQAHRPPIDFNARCDGISSLTRALVIPQYLQPLLPPLPPHQQPFRPQSPLPPSKGLKPEDLVVQLSLAAPLQPAPWTNAGPAHVMAALQQASDHVQSMDKLSELFLALRQHQHPAACRNQRALVLTYSPHDEDQGFSVIFQHIAAALAVAYADNRILVEVSATSKGDAWTRAPRATCHGHKFDCFFRSLSSCTYDPVSNSLIPTPAFDASAGAAGTEQAEEGIDRGQRQRVDGLPMLKEYGQSEQFVQLPGLYSPHELFHAATSGEFLPQWFETAPDLQGLFAPFGVRNSRHLWFPAIELYLFQPLPRIQQRFAATVRSEEVPPLPNHPLLHHRGTALWESYQAAQRAMAGKAAEPWPQVVTWKPIVAMHHRAGDTCQVVYRMQGSIGDAVLRLQHLLVASRAPLPLILRDTSFMPDLDKPQPVSATEGTAAAPAGGPLILLATDSKDFRTHPDVLQALQPYKEKALSTQLGRIRDVTDGVIADILLLSEGHFFLGSCFSQVSRLAAELAYAKGRLRHAPVGSDALQCRAYVRQFYPIPLDWRSEFAVWAAQ